MMLEDWITELNVNRLSQPYSTLAVLKSTGTFGMCDYMLILVCHNHLKLLKPKQKGFQAFTSSESFLDAFFKKTHPVIKDWHATHLTSQHDY